MTRDEHMEWCKKRALEYLPHNPREAVTSMMSDLGKHAETKIVGKTLTSLGVWALMKGDPLSARDFIVGFN